MPSMRKRVVLCNKDKPRLHNKGSRSSLYRGCAAYDVMLDYIMDIAMLEGTTVYRAAFPDVELLQHCLLYQSLWKGENLLILQDSQSYLSPRREGKGNIWEKAKEIYGRRYMVSLTKMNRKAVSGSCVPHTLLHLDQPHSWDETNPHWIPTLKIGYEENYSAESNGIRHE